MLTFTEYKFSVEALPVLVFDLHALLSVIHCKLWCIFSSFGPTTKQYFSKEEKHFKNNSFTWLL